MRVFAAAVVLLFLAAQSVTQSAAAGLGTAGLRDLDKFDVRVSIDPEFNSLGQELMSAVLGKLKRNGFEIYPGRLPYLEFQVQVISLLEVRVDAYAFTIRASVTHPVTLMFTENTRMVAETWHSSKVLGVCGSHRLQEFVQRELLELVDEFIIDWYGARHECALRACRGCHERLHQGSRDHRFGLDGEEGS